jgi:isopentenyl-diphosphate delta-isomerase
VCGHPGEGESAVEAAKRRLEHELGLLVSDVEEIAPYQYRFSDSNGIVENEICPILVGHTNNNPVPHDHEVDAWKWVAWKEFLEDVKKNPDIYSPWCREEALILLQKDPELQ